MWMTKKDFVIHIDLPVGLDTRKAYRSPAQLIPPAQHAPLATGRGWRRRTHMISSCGTIPEIARWWRRRQGLPSRAPRQRRNNFEDDEKDDRDEDVEIVKSGLLSTNPRTLLLSVTRSKDGVAFIRERIRALRKQLRQLGDDPDLRFLLGLYLEKLGEDTLEEALTEMDRALARMPAGRGSGWARSERSRLEKACEASRLRMKALSAAGGLSCSSPWSTRRGAIISDSNSRSSSSSSDDVEQGRPSATKSRKRPRKAEPASSGITGGEGVGGNRLLLPTTSCNYTRFEAVDERNADMLTYEEFVTQYAMRGRPVVIKGGISLCFADGKAWDRESLRQEAGEKLVPVRRWVPGSVSWARLEEAGHLPLSTVLGTRDNTDSPHGGGTHVVGGDTSIMTPEPGDGPPEGPRRGNSGTKKGEIKGDGGLECRDSSQNREKRHERREPLYLHDWSLPQNLGPDSALLAGRFQVPRFFGGDMLQRLSGQGLPYCDSWPSLFVGPKGSKSDTHIDSFGSHFWMGLLEGQKRWLLFPREEASLLYPVWPEGCHDPIFEADLETPDPVRHPAASLATGFRCVMEAGDVLFVPAGCPHHVENLTDTLALSCNYVDATNIDGAIEALEDQALTDPAAGNLAAALASCDRSLVRLQTEVPWAALKTKAWPRRQEEVADWKVSSSHQRSKPSMVASSLVSR